MLIAPVIIIAEAQRFLNETFLLCVDKLKNIHSLI